MGTRCPEDQAPLALSLDLLCGRAQEEPQVKRVSSGV